MNHHVLKPIYMWILTKWILSSPKRWILHGRLSKGSERPLQWHQQSIMDLFEFPFQVNEVYYVARRILHHL